MEVTEDIEIHKKQKSQNRQMSHISPYVHFNCPYLKIGLCDLFLVLLEYVTYIAI